MGNTGDVQHRNPQTVATVTHRNPTTCRAAPCGYDFLHDCGGDLAVTRLLYREFARDGLVLCLSTLHAPAGRKDFVSNWTHADVLRDRSSVHEPIGFQFGGEVGPVIRSPEGPLPQLGKALSSRLLPQHRSGDTPASASCPNGPSSTLQTCRTQPYEDCRPGSPGERCRH